MKLHKHRLYKYTWTGTAGDDTGDLKLPDTIEMVNPNNPTDVIKALGTDEAVNVLLATRLTVQYDTDEITGAATFDFHVLGDVYNATVGTKHTAYFTLDSAIPKDNIRPVPVTPNLLWAWLRLDANANFGDGESVYCYLMILE